jgi:hypothetical protein
MIIELWKLWNFLQSEVVVLEGSDSGVLLSGLQSVWTLPIAQFAKEHSISENASMYVLNWVGVEVLSRVHQMSWPQSLDNLSQYNYIHISIWDQTLLVGDNRNFYN